MLALFPARPRLFIRSVVFYAEPIRNCFYSTAGWMSRSAVVLDCAGAEAPDTLPSMRESPLFVKKPCRIGFLAEDAIQRQYKPGDLAFSCDLRDICKFHDGEKVEAGTKKEAASPEDGLLDHHPTTRWQIDGGGHRLRRERLCRAAQGWRAREWPLRQGQ